MSEPQRRFIKAVSRALDILETLAASREPMSLAAIGRRIELGSSDCHHLLATLVARGYVQRSDRGLTYHISDRVILLKPPSPGQTPPPGNPDAPRSRTA